MRSPGFAVDSSPITHLPIGRALTPAPARADNPPERGDDLTSQQSAPPTERFRFSRDAEPFRLRETEPHVHGYAWRRPDTRACLVLLHGLQSHAQWFAGAAAELAQRGLSVYAPDRRGSGSSRAPRGDVARYEDWLDDVQEVVRLAREESAGAPVHLVGHCFGANLAVAYALTRPSDVASVVMLTPGFYVLPDYSIGEKAQIVLAGLTRPERRFRVPQDDELFTHDPEVLAWIKEDTLGSKAVTARSLMQIRRLLRFITRKTGSLGMPVLVLEAARDRLSDNRRNRALLERDLGDRARIVSFEAEHFLLAEPCAPDVLDELDRWVSAA